MLKCIMSTSTKLAKLHRWINVNNDEYVMSAKCSNTNIGMKMFSCGSLYKKPHIISLRDNKGWKSSQYSVVTSWVKSTRIMWYFKTKIYRYKQSNRINKLLYWICIVFTFRLVDLDCRLKSSHLLSFSLFLEPLKSTEATKNRTNFNEKTLNLTFMWTRQNVFPLSAKLARNDTLNILHDIIQITKSLKTPLSGIISPEK